MKLQQSMEEQESLSARIQQKLELWVWMGVGLGCKRPTLKNARQQVLKLWSEETKKASFLIHSSGLCLSFLLSAVPVLTAGYTLIKAS